MLLSGLPVFAISLKFNKNKQRSFLSKKMYEKNEWK